MSQTYHEHARMMALREPGVAERLVIEALRESERRHTLAGISMEQVYLRTDLVQRLLKEVEELRWENLQLHGVEKDLAEGNEAAELRAEDAAARVERRYERMDREDRTRPH